jgi:hypothetical protein
MVPNSLYELLNSVYTPPTALDIEGAANRILQHCSSDRQVSRMYGYHFIARLPPHITLVHKSLLHTGTTGVGECLVTIILASSNMGSTPELA